MPIFAKLVSCLVVLLVLGSRANAVVVETKSLDELVANAPVIVIGTVTGVQYVQFENLQRPYTEIALLIQEVVAGADKIDRQKGDKIALLFAGGLSEKGYFDVFVGMPELRLGETYLLLLKGGEWTLNPIAGWNQGVFRLVGINDKGGKLVLSLDDAVLVGVSDTGLEFASPNLGKIHQTTEPAPEPGQESGGLELDDEYKPPQQQGKARQPLYREDNVEELASEDAERAKARRAENLEVSREKFLEMALGGVQPLLLDEFRAELKKRHEKLTAQLEKMEFSFTPVPLADTLEGEHPAAQPKQNR